MGSGMRSLKPEGRVGCTSNTGCAARHAAERAGSGAWEASEGDGGIAPFNEQVVACTGMPKGQDFVPKAFFFLL